MKLTEVRYKSPTGRKPPPKQKRVPLPNPQAKQAYEGYSKDIDKTILDNYNENLGHDEGPELFGILADLQDVVKSIEADK